MGIGTRLVDECVRFGQRRAGYRRWVLWTRDVLVGARRIYQAAGFELIEKERGEGARGRTGRTRAHEAFVEEIWARDL
ncbi:hypothetical protein GCM10018952_22350 [Streptosporangium vulgare]